MKWFRKKIKIHKVRLFNKMHVLESMALPRRSNCAFSQSVPSKTMEWSKIMVENVVSGYSNKYSWEISNAKNIYFQYILEIFSEITILTKFSRKGTNASKLILLVKCQQNLEEISPENMVILMKKWRKLKEKERKKLCWQPMYFNSFDLNDADNEVGLLWQRRKGRWVNDEGSWRLE